MYVKTASEFKRTPVNPSDGLSDIRFRMLGWLDGKVKAMFHGHVAPLKTLSKRIVMHLHPQSPLPAGVSLRCYLRVSLSRA